MFNSASKKRDFLKSIEYMTASDLEKNRTSMERLKKICPMLHEMNPLTHSLFLKLNPDISEEDRQFHMQVIATLMEKEQRQVKEALKIFENNKQDDE